ncbi:MAG: DeoR/GlpR family DNA-binding transcription regulator [Verrucomicrobiota bacterium]|nr:DeoR/GlpR family DNA-binding transcription regulator [Verrucomicrobiota bacterium]
MKVPFHVVQARRDRLAELLGQHRYLPVKELCRRLGVSEATARRDLAALVGEKKIKRTHGGALSEFNDRFPSFRDRQGRGGRAKAKIARAALAYMEPGGAYFMDSGTTICAMAEAFRDHPITPVTIVTSNLPVGEMLAAIPDVQVFMVAGQLLHLQSTLLGEMAQRSLEFWKFDTAFLSAEAMNPAGIWNSQAAIVDQQRVVLERSARTVFCIDGSKLNREAPHFLVPWDRVDALVTDVSDERLATAGISLRKGQRAASGSRPAVPHALPAPEEAHASDEDTEEMPIHIL